MAEITLDQLPYREYFATPDEHPDHSWGFLCNTCDRSVDEAPCPDHAPTAFPGLRLVECGDQPRHALTWVHDREDYGVPCFQCLYAAAEERLRLGRQCRHWPWRRWKLTRRAVGWAYQLGVVGGSAETNGDGHNWCVELRLRGSRVYVLGAARTTWRCWLRGHRRGEDVGLGYCGKCMPWACCRSTTVDHAAGCAEAVSRG